MWSAISARIVTPLSLLHITDMFQFTFFHCSLIDVCLTPTYTSSLSSAVRFSTSSNLSWRLAYHHIMCSGTQRSKQDVSQETWQAWASLRALKYAMLRKHWTTSLTVFTFLIFSSSLEIQQRERKQCRIILRQQATLTLKPTGLSLQPFSSPAPARQNLTPPPAMERVQHMTKSAIRRASQIEVNPQAKRNLQELFVNFTLILICLLLIYIIVLLSSWGDGDGADGEKRGTLARLRVDQGSAEIWGLLIRFAISWWHPPHMSAGSCLTAVMREHGGQINPCEKSKPSRFALRRADQVITDTPYVFISTCCSCRVIFCLHRNVLVAGQVPSSLAAIHPTKQRAK